MVHKISITDSLICLPDQDSVGFKSDPALRCVHRYKEQMFGIVFKGYNDKRWIVEAFIDTLKNKYRFTEYRYGTNAVKPHNCAEAQYFLDYTSMIHVGFTAAAQFLEKFTQKIIIPNTNKSDNFSFEIIDWKNQKVNSRYVVL